MKPAMIKYIKIATGVNKAVELGNGNMDAISVWEIVKEHREILIDRVIPDLANYVNYLNLGKRATPRELANIQARLATVRTSPSASRYIAIVDNLLTSKKEVEHIATKPVFQEIDDIIKSELSVLAED